MPDTHRAPCPLPYDPDAAFPAALDRNNVDAALERDRLHRSDVYATKEIRAGDQLEVEIYPEFPRTLGHLIPPEAKGRQRRAQKNLNEKNSRKQCERVINANFTDRDVWATFTYSPEHVPETMEQAQRNIQNYIRRVNRRRKRQGLPNTRYVYVTERSPKGRWHHHIVMDGGLPLDVTESCWTLGKRNQVRRLAKDENGLSGMAQYLTKAPGKHAEQKGVKRWVASKGLQQPDERVNHYKFRRRQVREMVRDAAAIRPQMERWYAPEGYVFTSAQVRYNDFNGRFYVYARLRLPPGRAAPAKHFQPPSGSK